MALRSRWSALACVPLVLHLPACSSWHVAAPTPAQFVGREQPRIIRVTRTDGTTLTLSFPSIRGDSLVGLVGNPSEPADTVRTVGLALTDISSVAVERSSLGRTVRAVVGGTVLLVGSFLAIEYLIVAAGIQEATQH